ncbi:MAG: ABC transporter permease [Thermoleophilia bacterium]|nr:ABC transporter permease [Thermoleophilia bacterium]
MSAEDAQAAGPSGAIYDIGYRGYDGPRVGRRARIVTLFTHTLRGAFGLGRMGRAKIAPILLLAALCVPALVMAGVVSFVHLDKLPVGYDFFSLDLQVLHTIWLGVLAPFVVSRDLRFRVTTLYFSRPLMRLDYLWAKYVATVAALLVMLVVPPVVLFIGALLGKLDARAQVRDLLPVLVLVALLALLLAAVGLLIASLAPRRGMGIAAIVAVLLVSSGVRAIVEAIAVDRGSAEGRLYAGMISPYSLVERIVAGLFHQTRAGMLVAPTAGQTLAFAGVFVVVLGGALLLLVRRYQKVSVL